MRWLQQMQQWIQGDADVEAGLWVSLVCVLAAKALGATLVLTTELVFSSVLAFDEVCFIKSCASAFSFNQSLKSMSAGLTQCFFTVKGDQDSFSLGGNFCIAVLRSEALLRSESYESDLGPQQDLKLLEKSFWCYHSCAFFVVEKSWVSLSVHWLMPGVGQIYVQMS